MSWALLRIAFLGIAVGRIARGEATVYHQGNEVTYKGTAKSSIEHFYNIKFAHDTSGERRFTPPEPYTPPPGSEVDATTPGPACPQSKPGMPPFFDETSYISEDCLNLRISRPVGTTAGDKLPVVVWVPGGGGIRGSNVDSHIDPENLITLSTALEKPVIFVSLNYRLTIFGFPRLPLLKDQKSLNLGLRDQRAGFQWIKDNIAAFGGDPDRITSFGLSAGGTMTSASLMAYGGEKGVPFTQAWVMSGPPGTSLNVTSDATEQHTRAVAETLDCGANGDEEVLKCLREVPMEKLLETAMEYSVNNHPPIGLFTFIPSTDGDFIPDRYSTLYKSGKFVKGIPMVFGWTQDDGDTNAGPAPAVQKEDDMKSVIKGFASELTDDDYEKLFSLYPASDFEEDVRNYEARKSESDPVAPVHYFRVSRILRDILFTCSSINFGYEMAKHSKALDPKFPGVRLYDLNQSMLTGLFTGAGMPYVGVAHGSDSNYIYNGVFPEGQVSEADQKLSRSMAASFINFAYTGVPTSYTGDAGFEEWPESFPEPELSKFRIQVIGGPLGTGISILSKEGDGVDFNSETGGMQVPLMGNLEFGEMEAANSKERGRQIRREKLFDRCAYIDSLGEKLGV